MDSRKVSKRHREELSICCRPLSIHGMKEHRPTNLTHSSLGARHRLTTPIRGGKVTVWSAHNAGYLRAVQDKGNKTSLSICALHRSSLTSVDALQHLPESRDGSEHQHRGEGCHQFTPQPCQAA